MAGCGGGGRQHRATNTTVATAHAPAQTQPAPPTETAPAPAPAPAPPPVEEPAFGITEDNANLLWSPTAAEQPPAAFRQAREELTALHPAYVRLIVDWADLQPTPDQPADLEGPIDGCAREVGPCGAYAGLREELAAIATQQQSTGGYRVILLIYGVPAWAARGPSGCEESYETSGVARALRPSALADYRALIRSVAVLGEQEGVALEWWDPWNEPNSSEFLAPQRASCSTDSPSLSAPVYARLAETMQEELTQLGGERHLVLGELAGYTTGSPHRTSIADFVAALPQRVICMSEVWGVHAYVTHGARPWTDPVGSLERALDARGPCGRKAVIWITETGVGAEDPGQALVAEAGGEQAACQALAGALVRWYGDPRVKAVLQYTFREDTSYPVGLVSADLSHLYPVYYLWQAWSEALAAHGPPPPLPAQCQG